MAIDLSVHIAGGPLRMYVLIGIPASGKTSFVHETLPGVVHISKDLMQQKRAGQNKEGQQESMIHAALAAGKSVVIDNTNPEAATRAKLICAAEDAGAQVIGYYFESKRRDCLQRNSMREGRARVPDKAVLIISSKLQLPRMEEGFDELWFVKLDKRGKGHVVTMWTASSAKRKRDY